MFGDVIEVSCNDSVGIHGWCRAYYSINKRMIGDIYFFMCTFYLRDNVGIYCIRRCVHVLSCIVDAGFKLANNAFEFGR